MDYLKEKWEGFKDFLGCLFWSIIVCSFAVAIIGSFFFYAILGGDL